MNMNKVIKRLTGHESGQALFLALLLLGVGSLVLAPLLSFMGSGLKAGVVVEDKTDELYAADAGVQDAIWKINNLPDSLPPPYALEIVGQYYDYSIAELNNIEVIEVKILLYDMDNSGTYKVTSTARGTEIVALIATVWLDFSGILDNVVTSPNGYDIQGGQTVIEPGIGEPGGPVGDYGGAWPTPQDLITWYSRDVDKDNPLYTSGELLLTEQDTLIGPAYIDNDFYVHNSNGNPNATLTLEGTLYITGQAVFGGNRDFTINMNGQTIFIESDVTGGGAPGTACLIDGEVTFMGSGCIIAVGDINFQPQMDASPTDYVLIMSLIGQTWMHPLGDFYGTLAGYTEVFIQNGQANWNPPPDDLNFPGGGGGVSGMIWGIHSWDIH